MLYVHESGPAGRTRRLSKYSLRPFQAVTIQVFKHINLQRVVLR